jgi:hypothetical protein
MCFLLAVHSSSCHACELYPRVRSALVHASRPSHAILSGVTKDHDSFTNTGLTLHHYLHNTRLRTHATLHDVEIRPERPSGHPPHVYCIG